MSPLSWNEIRDRALAFSREWATESSEDAEAKSFWDAFFNVFGVTRRRLASFELPVKQPDGHTGYIDLLWKGVILVEHKSRGKDLDRAFKQAADYFAGLKERDLPKYILVSDFARFRLYDLDSDAKGNTHDEFPLAELHKNINLFGFMAGFQKHKITPQDPVNIKAAEQLGKLHDALLASGYSGHPLEVMLVRLLFCLFAEDTTIFEKRQFQDFIESRTAEDGSDLGAKLAELFYNLNQQEAERQTALDQTIAEFPYVNGRLYEEYLPPAAFNRDMREALLECCALDWSRISPAIFGSLFQSVMSAGKRRELGAHYTSEENILKLIGPLFLDDLKAELEAARNNKDKLETFHTKLAGLKFLDPACGCGNFLVIAYREVRKLELEILRRLHSNKATGFLDVTKLAWCDVDQFSGIELEEFPVRIAEVAMWLMDHQMNLALSEAFGGYYRRLPLKKAATIVHGNALRVDWKTVVKPEELNYILGNPPFGGSKVISDEQRKELEMIFHGIHGAGVLDYVAAWYIKAADMMRENPAIKTALVSTNSITQGEQVGILWGELLQRGIKIQFAHRTFQWNSEARGKAAVHCVIIGFALESGNPSPALVGATSPRKRGEVGALASSPPSTGMGGDILTSPRLRGEVAEQRDAGEGFRAGARKKFIFEYETPKSEPHLIEAKNINPYLVDAPDIVLPSRNKPLCEVPNIGIGNKPIDGGQYLFTPEEKSAFLAKEPGAKKLFRPWIGSEEFINGIERWCLWLGDCSPTELRNMPEALKRVEAVRQLRKASKSAPTRKLADKPTRYHVENMPTGNYLVIPKVSSERRVIIPIGFLTPRTLSSDLVFIVPNATLYHFAMLSSGIHMAWMRYTCGRLESRYRYSKDIVYNNFPWPDPPDEKTRKAIEAKAQAILDARAAHPEASLADLYDPLTMPADLRKAHDTLDKAVDNLYGKKVFTSDAERVAFLFARYEQLTQAPLEKLTAKPKRTRKERN